MSEYLPISAYGVIGNDERCALVGQNGSVDWCCFPHLESPSVFAAILDDEAGGRFSIRPTAPFEANQEYVDRTNVLETTFETGDGTTTVTDFMPIRPGESPGDRFQQALYRKVDCVAGSVDLDVVFEPRFEYGRGDTVMKLDESVVAENQGAVGAAGDGSDRESVDGGGHDGEGRSDVLTLHADAAFTLDDSTATATVPLDAESTRWFRLQYGTVEPPSEKAAQETLEDTIEYWREWLDGCETSATDLFEFRSDWRDLLVRSTLVLKLLIHEETGSIPAAPTTSLPEEIGGELNWDYRFNWIRDAKFTIQALHTVGQSSEAHRYFEWFREIGHEDPADIQPVYGLHSEANLDEDVVEGFSGYRGSTPVRIGNAAAEQKQLDIYGTIVQGIYETMRYENGLSDEDWESTRALAEHVFDHWDERDESIWEFRDLKEHFVHSKLLCWVALDRALRLADEYDRDAPRERWADERDALREAIETRGYDEQRGTFVQYFGAEEALDATALLVPLYDFLPADDERVQSTIDTIQSELTTDDGLVFRFVNSPARPREPGGFVLCSCWLVDALVLSGRTEEANDLFENLIDHTTSLGLLSEMIHAEDGTFLGNYPQAFSHIGVLNSAMYLASASNDADGMAPDALSNRPIAPLFRRHGP